MPTTVPAAMGSLPQELRAPTAPLNWLLIGPLARECALWGEAPQLLVEHLQAVQPQARLYQLDLPGTGRLWRQRSPSHVQALVQDLRERALQSGLIGQGGQGGAGGTVGPVGPVGLLASSWSGCLATEWARQFPQEVGALVLISPAMRPFTRVLRSVRVGLWSTALALVLGRRSPLEPGSRLWRAHTRLREAPAGLLQHWQALRGEHPVRARTGLAQALAIWRYQTSRRRPLAQVLLLAGKRDVWHDWRLAAAISRAWGAALRLHPEAGHDLLLDDPQWVARSVAEWLLPVGSGGIGS